MSERLKIARNLLTNSGVIAISIGYQEVHNLVVLCQEMFDTKQVTCVTVQTSGGKPNGGFNYVQEYLVFIAPRDFEPNTMNFTGGIERSPFEGLTLSTFTKVTRPNQTIPDIYCKENNEYCWGLEKLWQNVLMTGAIQENWRHFHSTMMKHLMELLPCGQSAVKVLSVCGDLFPQG